MRILTLIGFLFFAPFCGAQSTVNPPPCWPAIDQTAINPGIVRTDNSLGAYWYCHQGYKITGVAFGCLKGQCLPNYRDIIGTAYEAGNPRVALPAAWAANLKFDCRSAYTAENAPLCNDLAQALMVNQPPQPALYVSGAGADAPLYRKVGQVLQTVPDKRVATGLRCDCVTNGFLYGGSNAYCSVPEVGNSQLVAACAKN